MSVGVKDERAPEFSVIITVYNKAEYIGNTIRSVLRQTYGDFEAIVVDDGSTDNSREVIASFDDGRLRYIYQENSGLPACARNKGMGLARGKFIALLDGDDYWHEEKLKRCKEALDANPSSGLVCHDIACVSEGRTVKIAKFGPYVDHMYDKLLFDGNCLGPSAVVIRREVFFDDGFRFNEDRTLFALEDYEYWLQLSRRYRFCFIPDILGYYTATNRGAFSRDTEGNAVNMLRLLDKHFAQFGAGDRAVRRLIKRRRSAVMGGAGRMYNHMKEFGGSRRWYVKALLEYPFNYKAYIGLVASLARFSIAYK